MSIAFALSGAFKYDLDNYTPDLVLCSIIVRDIASLFIQLIIYEIV